MITEKPLPYQFSCSDPRIAEIRQRALKFGTDSPEFYRAMAIELFKLSMSDDLTQNEREYYCKLADGRSQVAKQLSAVATSAEIIHTHQPVSTMNIVHTPSSAELDLPYTAAA